jgi:hypothetical protein
MGVGTFIRRLDRLAGRFNKWFAPAAIAANVVQLGDGRSTIDPMRVGAVLREIEGDKPDEDHREAPSE